jgi:hypothetical protein
MKDKNIFVVALNNCDEWVTKPTHVAFVVTPPLLFRLIWDMLTWKIASILNRNLHQYETLLLGLFYWLDAKCGCVDICHCGAETPLGIMAFDQMENWYEQNFEDGDYMGTPRLVVEGWGRFRLKIWREYCPSQYDSREFTLRELLDPFLPWVRKAVAK